MKKIIAAVAALSLVSCGGLDLPETKESLDKIAVYSKKLRETQEEIKNLVDEKKFDKDIIIRIKKEPLNRILRAVAYGRDDDVTIKFPPTIGFVKEDKSLFGIKYTNYVNIDDGEIEMNLKKFQFEGFRENAIEALLEIEGKGFVEASGKYAGVGANVSPETELYINEIITLNASAGEGGDLILSPAPKDVSLKIKIYIKLLQWRLPVYHTINLKLQDLIKPIRVPAALASEIDLPKPAESYGDEKIRMEKYKLLLKNSAVKTESDVIELGANIDIKPK